MVRKIFKIQTTEGVRFGIGTFNKGEMLKGRPSRLFKTKKGAGRSLKRLGG